MSQERSADRARSELLSSVSKSLALLPSHSRPKLALLVGATMSLSLLDLVGVLLMGALGVALIELGSGQAGGGPSLGGLLPVDLGEVARATPQVLAVLGAAAVAFLLAKSALGAWLSRRILLFLARRQAAVTRRLTDLLFSQPLPIVERRTTQETAYALTTGVASAIVGLLGATALALGELTLLTVLGMALLIYNPLVTVIAFLFFGLLALFLYGAMGPWAGRTGHQIADATHQITRSIQETVSTYRELMATNRMAAYVAGMAPTIWESARATATGTFIAQFPKYLYESGLLVAAAGLSVWAFTTQPLAEAVATVTVFVAAGSRILPSLLRLQHCAFTIRYASGQAQSTYALNEDLGPGEPEPAPPQSEHQLDPTITIDSVTYRYPGSHVPAVRGVSLRIPAGGDVAIVGPTGSGKSTLVDVLLGILPPNEGTVSIGGLSPRSAIRAHPGAIGYLPQAVALVSGSVRTNVALGVLPTEVDDDRVWDALHLVGLDDFLRTQRLGLETEVGERGLALSGGQRQRIGLARALYDHPRLLILDEATSALDAETENAITTALSSLGQGVTRITIAHRLTTVRAADMVVYLQEGNITAIGSFAEVRAAVPEFDRSARLLGL